MKIKEKYKQKRKKHLILKENVSTLSNYHQVETNNYKIIKIHIGNNKKNITAINQLFSSNS